MATKRGTGTAAKKGAAPPKIKRKFSSQARPGEMHGSAKLTEKDVLRIRKVVAKTGRGAVTKLAKEYGISMAAIFLAATGGTWPHLPGAVAKTRTLPYKPRKKKATKKRSR